MVDAQFASFHSNIGFAIIGQFTLGRNDDRSHFEAGHHSTQSYDYLNSYRNVPHFTSGRFKIIYQSEDPNF